MARWSTSVPAPQPLHWHRCWVHARSGRRASPANLPFVILGGGILWLGWTGFNGGSAFAANGDCGLAIATTYVAAAAAMVMWITVERILDGAPTSIGAMSGAERDWQLSRTSCSFQLCSGMSGAPARTKQRPQIPQEQANSELRHTLRVSNLFWKSSTKEGPCPKMLQNSRSSETLR